jgi:hypothetical protein
MSKYRPLAAFLGSKSVEQISMTFAEVEKVLGFRLPSSAYEHPAWWANDTGKSHVQARAWLSVGYETEQVDKTARKLVFRRIKRGYGLPSVSAPHSGMAEPQSAFKHQEGSGPKRSPLWGALKGMLWIEPGYDLAQSPFTEEELDEMDRRMEERAALIEAGMRKPK